MNAPLSRGGGWGGWVQKYVFCLGEVVQEALSEGGGWGGRVQKIFFCQGVVVQEALSVEGAGCKTIFQIWHFFFDIQFKNTYNLILLGFKLSSERFLFKDFKTDLTFWHMWFFNFQNLVRSCQHIDGTPCILYVLMLSSKALRHFMAFFAKVLAFTLCRYGCVFRLICIENISF